MKESPKRLERIEEELKGEPTGFDVLVKQKQDNIWTLYYLIKENPNLTRREMAEKLDVSLRTVSRYLAMVRRLFRKGTFKSQSEKQQEERESRVKRMKQLLSRTPGISASVLAQKLGVSKVTLYQYLKEIGKA